jgi:Tfp pilus assembly protein PilF
MRNGNTFPYLFIIILVGVLLLFSVSCSNNQNEQSGIQRLNGDQAEMLNASHSTFDTPKDPPFNPETRYAAGKLAETQGQPEAAMQQYVEALKGNPKHQDALYSLAVLQTKAKMYPQAIETWKRYVSVCNGSATASNNLAFCFELAGRNSDAETTYKSGIKKEPKNEPCRTNYGLFLARNGRRKEAVEQLSAVLQPAEVHYNLGSVYEQMGRRDDARSEYEKALELDPQLWEAKSRMAKLE